jgi:hypothetical protein
MPMSTSDLLELDKARSHPRHELGTTFFNVKQAQHRTRQIGYDSGPICRQ